MGLDMYLSAKKYMSKYFDESDTAKIEQVNKIFGVEGLEDNDYGAEEVKFRVAYWRKANMIHRWFVENCQDGEDNCDETYVSREDLEKLLQLCKDVMEDMGKAEESFYPHKVVSSSVGLNTTSTTSATSSTQLSDWRRS